MQLLFNFYDDIYLNNLGIQPCGKYNGECLVYMGAKRTIAETLGKIAALLFWNGK